MHKATAKVILDSISPEGIRLTTVQVRFWRPMLPELNTHRAISKNAGSSRARPSKAIIEQVRNDPWGPIHWGKNQPGMQAKEELNCRAKVDAIVEWKEAAVMASYSAERLLSRGAHKQIVNRLLEPFTYVDVLLTATDWANFFALRLHEDAQPEMQDLARSIHGAMDASEPTLLQPGDWHLPYIQEHEWDPHFGGGSSIEELKRLSVSRCAKISYTAFDGTVEPIEKELARYSRLIESQPMHSSPCEHQATPDRIGYDGWESGLTSNLRGWIQLRKILPNEYVPG